MELEAARAERGRLQAEVEALQALAPVRADMGSEGEDAALEAASAGATGVVEAQPGAPACLGLLFYTGCSRAHLPLGCRCACMRRLRSPRPSHVTIIQGASSTWKGMQPEGDGAQIRWTWASGSCRMQRRASLRRACTWARCQRL